MAKFDVAILESKNMTKEDIAKLETGGAYTIGYLSIGEDDGEGKGEEKTPRKGDGKGPGGSASYHIADEEGNPSQNPDWKSWYVDAGNKDWQDYIINVQAKEILVNKGCDGLFLDTIDTVDQFADTMDGMIDLIVKLHAAYPDAKLVANRGFYNFAEYRQIHIGTYVRRFLFYV